MASMAHEVLVDLFKNRPVRHGARQGRAGVNDRSSGAAHGLSAANRQALKEMMKGYEYQSDFAKKYVAKARAHDVLSVLQVRGLDVPETARERILAEMDPAHLQHWVKRSVVVTSVDELLDELKLKTV